MSSILQEIQNGRSEARNKVVANVFKELGLIEQWGSGINRIKMICKKQGLQKPKMQEQNDFVDVEFYRPKLSVNDRLRPITVGKPSENRQIPPDCTEQEKRILEYIFENKTIKSKRVEELLGIKESRTRELLKKMVEKSFIIKLGSGRNTYYKAVGDE